MPTKPKKTIQQNPPLFLALGFMITILIGTMLLMQPIASKAGIVTPFIDALFTATSATCVTGLVVYNTLAHWTTFGHVVIILLIQIGGLGFMAMTILIAMALNRKITLSDRLVIKEQFGQESLTGMVRWMRYIVLVTLGIEGVGAILLSTQLIPEYGIGQGIWYSVFHSISAFCNAGFDLFGDSLVPYQLNPVVTLTIAFLIVIGGLGFGVYLDLFSRKKHQITLHTKLVLSITAILLVSGTILIFFIEDGNPATMHELPTWAKWMAAFFQSVTTRTAGYYSIAQGGMYEVTAVLSIILMFIGGSPAGTAGGIKTTTFAVLLLSTRAQLKGQEKIEVFNRTISSDVVTRALTIIMLGLCWVIGLSFFISVTEGFAFITTLFETVSAFATVGLTIDLTPELSAISKALLSLTMYMGRVGPVTLAYALIKRRKPKDSVNAYGNVMVG